MQTAEDFLSEFLGWRPSRKTATVFRTQQERAAAHVSARLGKHFFVPVAEMSLRDLKTTCDFLGIVYGSFLEKTEFVAAVEERRGKACTICGEDFVKDEQLRVTNCGHFGHEKCMAEWFGKSSETTGSAPVCWICRQDPFARPDAAETAERANRGKKRARE